MSVYQVLSLCGVGSLISAGYMWIYRSLKAQKAASDALKAGVQAILRDRLYEMYYKYKAIGHTNIDARANFENLYTQYHGLGANGVMDDIRNKFFAIDIEEA